MAHSINSSASAMAPSPALSLSPSMGDGDKGGVATKSTTIGSGSVMPPSRPQRSLPMDRRFSNSSSNCTDNRCGNTNDRAKNSMHGHECHTITMREGELNNIIRTREQINLINNAIAKKRKRKRPLMLIPCFLLLLPSCCHSSSISVGGTQQVLPYRKRRNNTGFYYGIRDDDIMLSSSFSPARFKPTIGSLSTRLNDGVSNHFTAMARRQRQLHQHTEIENTSTDSSSGYDSSIGDSSMQSTTQTQQQQQNMQQHPSSTSSNAFKEESVRDKLAKYLSQSIMHSQLHNIDPQRWNAGRSVGSALDQQGDQWSMITNKAMSLLGGATSKVPHSTTPLSKDAIVNTSSSATMTKQKPKQQQQQQQRKKRRKNNTGFYYGIREDVLVLPEVNTRTQRQKKSRGITVSPRPPPQTKSLNRQEKEDSASNKDLSSDGDEMGGTKVQDKGGMVTSPKVNSTPSRLLDNDPPTKKRRRRNNTNDNKKKPPRQKKKEPNNNNNKGGGEMVAPGMSNVLSETLFELREMKEEIVALREELRAVKDKLKRDKLAEEAQPEPQKEKRQKKSKRDQAQPQVEPELETPLPEKKVLSKRARNRNLEKIGKDVEQWASHLLFEQEDPTEDGWKAISCNNFVKKKFNKFDRTQVYLKWMPDSRDEKDIESNSPNSSEETAYPCLKCYTTIDAPLDQVCSFLANPDTIPLYNELVVDHSDVEEITPSSKITWCKCPKILFVKPRDFVTYCSHRWRKDGTQIIVNQACEHEDVPGVMVEGQGDVCRGFAIRGANFISKDPEDPNKTRITMLSHANPGGGLPQWAMNTAVNAVVQIEPFKFFHNINESICNYQHESTQNTEPQTSNVGNLSGRSNKPAGIAHLGFTCFWPNGGGLKEEGSTFQNLSQQQQDLWEDEDDDDTSEELDD